jgi:hypothetical protein
MYKTLSLALIETVAANFYWHYKCKAGIGLLEMPKPIAPKNYYNCENSMN